MKKWFQHSRPRVIVVASAIAGMWFASRAAAAADADLAHAAAFERSVAPILMKNCLGCHNASQAEGGLNLSTAESLRQGGKSGSPVEPGNVDDSYLLYRVREKEMPPPGKGRPLAEEEVAELTAWVKTGAVWPKRRELSEFEFTTERRAGRDWWSWQPVVRPPLPNIESRRVRFNAPDVYDATAAHRIGALKRTLRDSVSSPIDAFIQDRLLSERLTLSPPANRATLARRVYFDLTGLPPAPGELDEFLGDFAPDAFERLVDRLLASPRHGERWGRHWLDVVRFGETNGYETNTPRDNAWPYRDYVIQALNDDRPYDRFIREQLVGDLLGIGAATGFLVGGPKDVVGINTVEGTRQQRLDDLDDIAATTASAFLGLTINCAKCHNHKFDPVSQADTFRLHAALSGVQHGDRPVESPDYQRRKHQLPVIATQLAAVRGRLAELDRALDELGEPLAVVVVKGAVASSSTSPKRPSVSTVYNVDRFSPVAARFVRFTIDESNLYEPCLDELEIFTAGAAPQNVALATAGAKATASGVYDNGNQPIHQLRHVHDGRYGNSFSWISNERGRGWVQIELAQTQTIERVAWARDREGRYQDRLATSYRIELAVEPGKWTVVANSEDRQPFDARQPSRSRRSPDRLPAEQARQYRDLQASLVSLEKQLPQPTILSYAGSLAARPEPTRRLNRGDVMQPQEEVAPGAIQNLGPPLSLPRDATDAQRRSALADWIVDPRHPLTARVIVNRLWHYHFGQGLVATPSNFGFLGGKPSHPELLDWLAAEIVARDWSLKAMHRAMVLSATYRQSSADRVEGKAVDAGCRVLWRYPPRRLEAEPIRDAMLAVAGTLDLRVGGPGYSVFEPNDNYVRVYIPKTKFGPAEWRRMVYQTKPRMQHDATFGTFDCPDASAVTPARNTSTTALQALNLLNGPLVMQQAEQFAQRLRREAPADISRQARLAFRLSFGREPDAAEHSAVERLVREHGLPALCRALFNASEFVYIH